MLLRDRSQGHAERRAQHLSRRRTPPAFSTLRSFILAPFLSQERSQPAATYQSDPSWCGLWRLRASGVDSRLATGCSPSALALIACRGMVFPLFDLPPEAVELVLGFVEDLEDKRALRLAGKRSRAVVDAAVVAVKREGGDDEALDQTHLSALVGAPWRLLKLELRRLRISAAGAAALAAADWRSLQGVHLHGASLGDEGAAALAAAAWPDLQLLDLSDNNIALAEAHWPGLRELVLPYNFGVGAVALSAARWTRIQRLDLTECNVGASGAAALAAADWPSLRSLSLGAWLLGNEGAIALAGAEWPRLEHLSLFGHPESNADDGDNRIGPEGVVALAAANWPCLQTLSLSLTYLRDGDAAALATAHWPDLRTLRLAYNRLGPMGAVALTEGKWPSLVTLDLEWNGVGAVGAASLVLLGAKNWSSLQSLNLKHNNIEEECTGEVEALAAAQWPGLHLSFAIAPFQPHLATFE